MTTTGANEANASMAAAQAHGVANPRCTACNAQHLGDDSVFECETTVQRTQEPSNAMRAKALAKSRDFAQH